MKSFTNSAKIAITDKIISMQSPSKIWVCDAVQHTTGEVINNFTNIVKDMIDDEQIDLNDFDNENELIDYLFKNAMQDGSLFDYCTLDDYADAKYDAELVSQEQEQKTENSSPEAELRQHEEWEKSMELLVQKEHPELETARVIGRNIAAARKAQGLSQIQFACKICATQNQVSRWESGITEPNIANLNKIAKALGVVIEDLLK